MHSLHELINKRSFDVLIQAAEQHGISEEHLTRELSFTHADLLKHQGYVTWDEFATYCQRLEDLLGGPEAILEIGQVFLTTPVYGPLLQFGGLFTSSKWLYHIALRWFGPMMNPAIKNSDFKEINAQTIQFTLSSPAHLTDAPAVFRIIASLFRYAPTLLGIQPSVVSLQIYPHQAIYTLQMPPSLTLPARLKRALHSAWSGQSILNELTEQHQTLLQNFENLQQSEKNFRMLINNSPDGIIIFTPQKILFANPAMVQFLDAQKLTNLIGKPIEHICQKPQSLALWEDPPSTQTRHSESLPFLKRNGDVVWAETNTFRAYFNGEKACVSITRDITERQRVLTRAVEMDRMISMGILAAGIGHEIRNPLSYLQANLAYAQNALQSLRSQIQNTNIPTASQTEWQIELTEIEAATTSSLHGTQRLIEISQDLNSFSRNSETRLELVFIKDAINAAINIARHEIRHRATIITELSTLPAIHANATQLSQVILNLLINAAQAIPLGNVDENQITIRTFHDEQHAFIEIQDTGCGIPTEVLEYVFDPFFTTKPPGEGTGLGLSISKNLIEKLNGTLTITSGCNEGTRALISLPLPLPSD